MTTPPPAAKKPSLRERVAAFLSPAAPIYAEPSDYEAWMLESAAKGWEVSVHLWPETSPFPRRWLVSFAQRVKNPNGTTTSADVTGWGRSLPEAIAEVERQLPQLPKEGSA